jgi:hypothetical protein
MTIAFTCENCGKDFQTDAGLAGKKCRCKQCGHIFVIPGGAASASRASAASAMPPRTAVPLEDDEEFLPPGALERVSPKTKRKKKKPDEIAFFSGVPGPIYLSLACVLVVLGVWWLVNPSTGAPVFTVAILLSGGLLALYGSIGFMVLPFRESVDQGLLCLFVPFYGLYYLVTRWREMRGVFFAGCLGAWVCVIPAVLLPAIAAARNAAEQERARFAARQAAAGAPFATPPAAGPTAAAAPNLDATARDLVETLEAMANLLEGIRYEASARSSKARLVELDVRMKGLAQAVAENQVFTDHDANAFEKISEQMEKLAVGVKYSARAKAAKKRIEREVARIARQPVLQAALADTPGPPPRVAGRVPRFAPGFGPRRSIDPRAVPGAPPIPRNPQERATPQVGGLAEQGRPADSDFVAQVLFDLKSPALPPRKDALSRLQNAPPEEPRRVEVARAVVPMLKDPDMFVRADAALALSVWGGPENTPALVEALRDPSPNIRRAVLRTIATIKDPAAAGPVAALLVGDRSIAAETLRAIGPPAEDAVIPYLDHGDGFVRMEAARILQAVGTEKCVPALQALLRRTGGQGLDAMAVRDALRALNAPEFPTRKRSGAGGRH